MWSVFYVLHFVITIKTYVFIIIYIWLKLITNLTDNFFVLYWMNFFEEFFFHFPILILDWNSFIHKRIFINCNQLWYLSFVHYSSFDLKWLIIPYCWIGKDIAYKRLNTNLLSLIQFHFVINICNIFVFITKYHLILRNYLCWSTKQIILSHISQNLKYLTKIICLI